MCRDGADFHTALTVTASVTETVRRYIYYTASFIGFAIVLFLLAMSMRLALPPPAPSGCTAPHADEQSLQGGFTGGAGRLLTDLFTAQLLRDLLSFRNSCWGTLYALGICRRC